MPELKIESDEELIKTLSESDLYKEFKEERLKCKIDREQRTWDIIKINRGKYSEKILNNIFDTVDIYDESGRWFGQLLAKPNRNLIFETPPEHLNKWMEELLFSSHDLTTKINTCLGKLKIKGASKGLVTLLLYLSNPQIYNIWVNKTEEGLYVLNLLDELDENDWGSEYNQFNKAANEFKKRFKLQPQEIDWFLTIIASYVNSSDDYFLIDEDLLKTEEIPISVDDEPELDDVVGEPMELKVMRWTPTNEMGVVALFVEFRKELNFPIIDIIRTNFPDAAVFESSSKGHIRRYIEFEFRSSGFKSHLRSKRKCHYVVCWEHNWKGCPIPVIELKTEILKILSCK